MGKLKLFITLGSIAVLVGVPAVTYFGFVRDVKSKQIEYEENYTFENVMNDFVLNCLDNTKTDKKISLAITEKQFNSAAYSAIKDTDIAKFVPQIYGEFNKGMYNFVVQVKAKLGPLEPGTKLIIKTKIEETERADMDGAKCFVFKFRDILIGKLGGLENIGINIIKNIIPESQLEDMLAQYISVKVSYKEKAFIYKKDDIAKDVDNLLSSAGGDFPLSDFFKTLFERDMVHADTNINGAIKFDVDLTDMTQNSEYVESYDLKLNDESKYGGFTLDFINSKVKEIVNANDKCVDKADTIFNFLFKGFDNITGTEQNEIKGLNLSTMGAGFDYETHKGFEFSGETINQIAANQIEELKTKELSYFTAPSFDFLSLSESQINDYLKTTGFVGWHYLINGIQNDSFKSSYICVDNLYSNIYDNHTEFVAGLNINGLETSMIISTELDVDKSKADFSTKDFKIAYNIKSLKFGNIELNKGFSDIVFSILASSLSNGMFVSQNADKTYTLTVDFSNAIRNSVDSFLSTALGGRTFEFVTSGVDKEANGKISIVGKN